jgi:hypothetical protein
MSSCCCVSNLFTVGTERFVDEGKSRKRCYGELKRKRVRARVFVGVVERWVDMGREKRKSKW